MLKRGDECQYLPARRKRGIKQPEMRVQVWSVDEEKKLAWVYAEERGKKIKKQVSTGTLKKINE